ncbi:MAG: TM0106 family RecB-like putative nuclease [Candidatus Eiseniibacteriota bacterium]|nr:MAG: TM0106 family RecB-like putative nuclease [Candidatus Eisenbacteria bacterium]
MGRKPLPKMPAITATHIYDYLMCPHRVYLDEFGDKALMDEESDFQRLLWERGSTHEEEALERLGLDVCRVDLADPEERERETFRLMKKGENFIYQGGLSSGSMRGRPDLLEKTEGRSRFGSHFYVPVELKSGSAYQDEDAGTLKEHYVLQLSFYADVLEQLQGTKPENGKIIDGEFRVVPVELAPFELDYAQRLSEIRALFSGEMPSEPCIGSICGQCHWQTYCLDWAKERDDVSLVRRVSRPRKESLKKGGISTVGALADLAKKKSLPSFDRISTGALQQMVRRAVVIKQGKPVINSPVELPVVELELFFDIETEPWEDVCYLYGVVERRKDGQRFLSFFADSHADEERTWHAFWEYISGMENYHMYHYAPYERRILAQLSERYSCDPELFRTFFANSTDLYRVVERHTDWPSHSYSIKSVSKSLGFEYSEPDPGGLKAAMWYQDFAQNPETGGALKERIIQYNKEDCEAMIVLKDWLVAKSRELEPSRRKGPG